MRRWRRDLDYLRRSDRREHSPGTRVPVTGNYEELRLRLRHADRDDRARASRSAFVGGQSRQPTSGGDLCLSVCARLDAILRWLVCIRCGPGGTGRNGNYPFDRCHRVSGFRGSAPARTLGDGLVGSSDEGCAAGFRWRRGSARPARLLTPETARLGVLCFPRKRFGSRRRHLRLRFACRMQTVPRRSRNKSSISASWPHRPVLGNS